jgi:hypothetical protein
MFALHEPLRETRKKTAVDSHELGGSPRMAPRLGAA